MPKSEHTQTIGWRPSTTAGFVAFCRACANKEKDERFRGPDYLAQTFHISRKGLILKQSAITLPMLRKRMPGVYECISISTRIYLPASDGSVFGRIAGYFNVHAVVL
jgi:hypothetical protein